VASDCTLQQNCALLGGINYALLMWAGHAGVERVNAKAGCRKTRH